jgi:hypothetical protein
VKVNGKKDCCLPHSKSDVQAPQMEFMVLYSSISCLVMPADGLEVFNSGPGFFSFNFCASVACVNMNS